MRLFTAIEIFGGGFGSGCTGPNCGRPSSGASVEHIHNAVAPLKNSMIERTEQVAREKVAQVFIDLAAHGNDLRLTAPYPRGTIGRNAYIQAVAKHKFYSSLVMHKLSSLMQHQPDIVYVDPQRVEKFVSEAKQTAADDYDAFVHKLQQKIGPVTSASLDGNHVWGYSHLTVTKSDGSTEKWRTQTIINMSKLEIGRAHV